MLVPSILRQVPSGISPTWNFFIKEIKRHIVHHKMAHRYECSHDADVCFNSSRRLQNSTKHSNSLLCESISFLRFLRYYQHMAFVAQCGSEDIGFTAIFQFQTLAQFGYGKREVADGDVRLGDS